METNEKVLFGNYYQTDAAQKEPIEWIVIEKTDTYATLISAKILSEKAFNDNHVDWWTWENSTLKNWLNTEFLDEAFSDSEKQELIPDDNGCLVFILTCLEASRLMTEEQRAAKMTEYAYSKGIFRNDCWWVCSRGYSASDTIFVKSDGYLNGDAYDQFSTLGCGVRPCVRIRL